MHLRPAKHKVVSVHNVFGSDTIIIQCVGRHLKTQLASHFQLESFFYPFASKSDQYHIYPQKKYYITQYEVLGFS